MARSRLIRHLEKQSKKNLYLSILGIVLVIFFIFKLGIPLLVNFSLFVGGLKDKGDVSENKVSNSFIAPPMLDPLPTATNSAQIVVSGNSINSKSIKLYLNDELVEKTNTDKDGKFEFANVELSKGDNTIKVKSQTDNKESDFSATLVVVYRDKEPSLSVDSPKDGQSFQKDEDQAAVLGKTDPGARVTVNEFWAIVDESGNFSYTLNLSQGENKLIIEAVDDAGNKKTQELKVTYSP